MELGVPQCSLLFVLYNICSMKYSEVNFFTDDILLSISGRNLADCLEKVNEYLTSLTKWLKFNKLNLSVSRTKNIVFTRRYVSEASNDAR
jgi:hypothetical protein